MDRTLRLKVALVVAIAAGAILSSAISLWSRLGQPIDGTRLNPLVAGTWHRDGILATLAVPGEDGLRDGDLVLAIDGEPLPERFTSIVMLAAEPRSIAPGATVTYTVERDGAVIDVPVTLRAITPSLVPRLISNWGTVVFAVVSFLVAIPVLIKRPDHPCSRPLFLWAALTFAGYPSWALGVSISDLLDPLIVPLHFASASVTFVLSWAVFLHFALVFPRDHWLLEGRRWLIPALYLTPWPVLLLAALVLAGAPGAFDVLQLGEAQTVVTSPFALVYAGLALAVLISSYRRLPDSASRQQVRWVLWGAGVAFLFAAVIWLLPRALVGRPLVSVDAMGLVMLLFPLSIALAVLRYRLLDIDTLINRTIVYTLLTAMVGGMFSAGILLSQRVFIAVTGERSDAAIVVTTLVVASAFWSLRSTIQGVVDRYVKARPAPATRLKSFVRQLETGVWLVSFESLAAALLDEAVAAFEARGGAVSVLEDGDLHLVHAAGDWDEAAITVPFHAGDQEYGTLSLAPRQDGRPYSRADRELLQQLASTVARTGDAAPLPALA